MSKLKKTVKTQNKGNRGASFKKCKCRANTIEKVFKHLKGSVVLEGSVELNGGKTTMSIDDWLNQEMKALLN